MKKDTFRRLFENALGQAIENAEQQLGRRIPKTLCVRLYGAGSSGGEISIADAVDHLYLSEDRFYRIIDVAVIAVSLSCTACFVRVSGHAPGPLEMTWNDPPGNGPFKQLISDTIQV